MQYYDLLEAEWQGIEETNTETGKRKLENNFRDTTNYAYINDLLSMEKCVPCTASLMDEQLQPITMHPLERSSMEQSTREIQRQRI